MTTTTPSLGGVRLTSENYQEPFQQVVTNCFTRCNELKETNPKNPLVETFCKYPYNAAVALQKYKNLVRRGDAVAWKTYKNKIVEDLSFYKQQCNAISTALKSELTLQYEKTKSRLFKFLIVVIILVAGGIALHFLL